MEALIQLLLIDLSFFLYLRFDEGSQRLEALWKLADTLGLSMRLELQCDLRRWLNIHHHLFGFFPLEYNLNFKVIYYKSYLLKALKYTWLRNLFC